MDSEETVKKILSGEWHMCKGKVRKYSSLLCSMHLPGTNKSIIESVAESSMLYRIEQYLNELIKNNEACPFKPVTLEDFLEVVKETNVKLDKIINDRMDKEWTKP